MFCVLNVLCEKESGYFLWIFCDFVFVVCCFFLFVRRKKCVVFCFECLFKFAKSFFFVMFVMFVCCMIIMPIITTIGHVEHCHEKELDVGHP